MQRIGEAFQLSASDEAGSTGDEDAFHTDVSRTAEGPETSLAAPSATSAIATTSIAAETGTKILPDADESEPPEHKVEDEDLPDHGGDAPSRIRGALIDMAAMGLPEGFATRQAPKKGRARIPQIIERQDQRGGEMASERKSIKAVAEDQADRQAADIAEEDARDGLVERRKADQRAAKRGRQDWGRNALRKGRRQGSRGPRAARRNPRP